MSHCGNPCPCGYYGDTEKPYTCTMAMVTKYQKCISGPVLDRLDHHLDVPRVPMQRLASLDKEGLAKIRMAVERMRLTARAYHRILKLNRTIAVLAGSEKVLQPHLAEALRYRPRS